MGVLAPQEKQKDEPPVKEAPKVPAFPGFGVKIDEPPKAPVFPMGGFDAPEKKKDEPPVVAAPTKSSEPTTQSLADSLKRDPKPKSGSELHFISSGTKKDPKPVQTPIKPVTTESTTVTVEHPERELAKLSHEQLARMYNAEVVET